MKMRKPINYGFVLAVATIVLDIGAGIGYLYQKDIRKAVYWFAAAVITASVTF
jgi:hypothetical protein